MSETILVIGNRNYSSWSLRAWLMLKHTGVSFNEVRIALDEPYYKERLLLHSRAGRVPVLHHRGVNIWDTLAIAEYLAETYPEARLWPQDARERAHARSLAAEMHAGFAELRQRLPMNCRARSRRVSMTVAVEADIERIAEIWRDCRQRYASAGPWLFGEFSVADAMYAPVAVRFATYGIEPGPIAAAYAETVLNWPPLLEWTEAARMEPEVIAREEVGEPD